MSMNFGPLNKNGGERRLNVAITRATTEIVVFSSFDSSMIDLSRTKAVAVEHLKHFLEFAERGSIALAEIASAEHGVDHFDSDFEEAVAQALRSRGWKIQTQVGVSKFRVDLGILHPDKPGQYIAGIECDGATYHSAPAARDRDRVRQIILENLGWNILRLWSTDYFVDSQTAINKIHLQLTDTLEKDRLASGIESTPELDLDMNSMVENSDLDDQELKEHLETSVENKAAILESHNPEQTSIELGDLESKEESAEDAVTEESKQTDELPVQESFKKSGMQLKSSLASSATIATTKQHSQNKNTLADNKVELTRVNY